MVDFTMCDDDNCPYKAECRRHPDSGTKPDGMYQVWGRFPKRGPEILPENCDGWKPKRPEV